MSLPQIDVELVYDVCRIAVSRCGGAAKVAVEVDPLDSSVWLTEPEKATADFIVAALAEHGLAAALTPSGAIHVTGWDARILRRRLGVLLAGIDDLSVEWCATAELVMFHYDARTSDWTDDEGQWSPLEQVERALRCSVPFPRRPPRVENVENLLELVQAAEASYAQLIEEHIIFAEHALGRYVELLASTDTAEAQSQVLAMARQRTAA
jgi:hypothetical protein